MSIAFNGSTSKLVYDPGASLGLTYPFAIFAWLKPTSASVNQMVFGAAELGFTREAMIYAEGSSSGKVRAFHVGDSNGIGANSTTSVSTSWTPALAVFTSDTSRTIFYGAGAAVTENSTDTDLLASQLRRITVGVRAKDDGLPFTGDIAEVAIWSGGTALGQTEFDSLAAGAVPNTVSSSTLYDYWSLTTQASTHTGVNGRVLTATSTSQGSTHPLSSGYTLALDAGSYSVSGQAVTTTATRTIGLNSSSYSVSGQDVTFTYEQPGNTTIVLEPGSYLFEGSNVLRAISMSLDNGAYTVFGQDLDFTRTYPMAYTITLDPASYVWSGRSVALRYSGAPVVDTKQTSLSISIRMGL